jgi:hypothetical protein
LASHHRNQLAFHDRESVLAFHHYPTQSTNRVVRIKTLNSEALVLNMVETTLSIDYDGL